MGKSLCNMGITFTAAKLRDGFSTVVQHHGHLLLIACDLLILSTTTKHYRVLLKAYNPSLVIIHKYICRCIRGA